MAFELVILLLLTAANGLFSGAEIAILSVRKTRLRELVDLGSSRAAAVEHLRQDAERFLATVQIGITVVGATTAAYGGASISTRIEPLLRRAGFTTSAPEIAFVIVVALVSYLSIVLGELVPKSLALRYSEGYALNAGKPLRALAWGMRPLVWFLTASSNLILRLFGDRTTFTEARLSPDELQQLVEEATRTGSVHPRTGEIASRAFDLGQRKVAELMVPRPRVVCLDLQASPGEIRRVLLEEGHSRMPVYQGAPDHVVGYVVAKELLPMALERELIVLQDTLRPAYFVPRMSRALDVLQELQRRRTQLAVVVEESGAMAGIVTMEDLLEELVGEIFSEDEQAAPLLQREPDGSILVQATVPIHDVNRSFDLELPEDTGYSTIGGLCAALAGEIPQRGRILEVEGRLTIEVVESSPRRVKLVRLRALTPGGGGGPPGHGAREIY